MSYYANQLREHGRNYFDEDAANELDRLEDELAAANQKLAAQALTIKTMREALEKFIDSHEECTDFDGFTAQIVSMDDYHEAQEALALPNDATALNELIAERTKTQKEYYESVFQDGANRIAELTAQRDVAIGILEHIRRCIPYGGFAQIHDGSATVADIDAAIANCKEPGK